MSESPQIVLCPYCGHVNRASLEKCEECHGLFEPLSRKATQIGMGPWFVRNPKRPYHPGCSYEVIKRQALAGKLKLTSVVRGPTTKQFWSVARNTPGLAHLLGVCHDCGAKVKPDDLSCHQCKTSFNLPMNRNELGLQYKTNGEAETAQSQLDKQIEDMTSPAETKAGSDVPASKSNGSTPTQPTNEAKPRPVANTGGSLLDEVLGVGVGLGGESQAVQSPGAAAGATKAALNPNLAMTSGDEEEITSPQPVSSPAEPDEVEESKGLSVRITMLLGLNVVIAGILFWIVLNTSKQQGIIDTPQSVEQRERESIVDFQTDEAGDATSPTRSADSQGVSGALANVLEQAAQLERDGQLNEAMNVLRDYADSIPANAHPEQLKLAIQQLREKMQRNEAGTFFGD